MPEEILVQWLTPGMRALSTVYERAGALYILIERTPVIERMRCDFDCSFCHEGDDDA